MKRPEIFQKLAEAAPLDLVVIGGGATGLGLALDASLRGYSVALFESHDFASGTSSRSTKLLHGGVRYLAQGNVALVREALAERATVLRIAPHLAQPLAFVMPTYRWWQKPFYGLGLKLYDALAAWGSGGGLGPTEFLSREETLRRLPGVNPEGLMGGVQYWDAQFDDARLAVALARSAANAGALLLNHCAVTGLLRTAQAGAEPLIGGVRIQDQMGGQALEVRARCVVNATGVWVDDVRQMELAPTGTHVPAVPADKPRPDWQPMVSPSQGVHLVVDRRFMPATRALLVPKTRDGRVLFAVPWLGQLVLGTTDTPRDDRPREPRAMEAE
uniref:glycerol-3-phosphate dehydrogenase/oxidase n=1 Tax=Hydrogenophaga sp. TaxID=1904254 RepID=UPI0035674DC5